MGHSYCTNFVHCVFSTKNRRESVPPELEERLWAYISGIAENEKLPLLAIGGTSNHVHLLISLPASVALANAISKMKSNSSRWLGEHGIPFAWQQGYGAFSVGASQLPAVKRYIASQADQHKKRNFDEEFVMLLRHYGISFDPAYVYG
jgi:REP-associated tyrosine transposase